MKPPKQIDVIDNHKGFTALTKSNTHVKIVMGKNGEREAVRSDYNPTLTLPFIRWQKVRRESNTGWQTAEGVEKMSKRNLPIIAAQNSKLGKIPNVSTIPGADCLRGVPCAKISECYAMKFFNMYPNVRNAWRHNSQLAHKKPETFFNGIRVYVDKKRPRFFRWHVAGDILDQSYLNSMKSIAVEFPETKFLAFTKRYEFDYSNLPSNLSIVFSAWVEKPLPEEMPKDIHIAWVRDAHHLDNRIPKTAIECPGFCESCGMCWNLKTIKRDVVFHKH